ncbi:MlaD family protein [uncultured Thiocystis sp.]|jgi:phospholipid/cholesterol/gamma-HCH transport system substrate-binding protein|uniref:MlaD family protein n=1 Tax=uncultured Thiocystis sp. TaxID=1202134 RepID=UPI0025DCCD16|nr:MlaD family protein [uncultured Thiocystis sp.]
MNVDDDPSSHRLERLYAPPEIGAPGKRQARAQRRDLFLAGLFVLTMAAVLVGALALLLPGLFGRGYRVDAYFLEANGLEVGIQVIQEGYVIGLVERVTPVFPGRDADLQGASLKAGAGYCPPSADAPPRHPALPCFRATLRIRDAWPVPRDSVAQLGSAGLLKGDAIKIRPGQALDLLADGAVIDAQGREADLLAQVGNLTDTLKTLVDETVAPALISLRDQIKTIETLIGTGEDQGDNRARLAGAFENLRELSERLKESIDPQAIAAILASVRTLSENLAGMTAEFSGSTDDLQRAVTNYGELAVDLRALVRDNRPALQRTLDDTQFLLQELATALTPILTNIEDATRNLSALSRELRADPATILKRREIEEKTPWFQ